ncbi:MAG: hypothetical protein Q8O55_11015, partial [Dehalococcoidales bacterium]|nr:hypothetical protein [Dehalococcoidales bacterium]
MTRIDKSVKQTSRTQRFLEGPWLIPVLVLAYVGFMNMMPLGATVSYYIDVGGEDTSGKARITGPFDSMSTSFDVSGTTFRYLEKNPVYLELESSLLRNADEIDMNVRFWDDFPDDGELILGAGNKPGLNFLRKVSYVPFYQQLTELPLVASSGSTRIYATGPNIKAGSQNVDDFLQNLPQGSVLATNTGDLKSSLSVIRGKAEQTGAGDFTAAGILSIPPV